jgi:hypothetical protein
MSTLTGEPIPTLWDRLRFEIGRRSSPANYNGVIAAGLLVVDHFHFSMPGNSGVLLAKKARLRAMRLFVNFCLNLR